MELSPAALVGNALTSEINELRPGTPEGTAPTCDRRELTKPEGSAEATGGRLIPDGTTFDGNAPTWDSIELSPTPLVGRALMSEIKLLRPTAPEGSAFTCDNKELTIPDGTPDTMMFEGRALTCESSELSAAGLVGKALTPEIKLLIPPGTAPEGSASTWDNKELAKPDGSADAAMFEGRAPT
jgi:hypothetical protein